MKIISRYGRHEKRMGTMDRVLIVVGFALAVFTVTMILLYIRTGGIPDTLCTCVYSVLGGECGVLGWIKTSKDRNRERKWEKEDRKNG